MLFNEDKRIQFPVRFLQEKNVIYVDSQKGEALSYIEKNRKRISHHFGTVGYIFTFLPELIDRLSPEMLHYLLPGQNDNILVDDIYQRVLALAGLNAQTGFLYKQNYYIYFRPIPEGSQKEIERAIDEFVVYLSETEEPESGGILFSKTIAGESDDLIPVPSRLERALISKKVGLPDLFDDTRFSIRREEESLDSRAQAIIDAWEKIESEFGVTLQDVEILLGYRVKLSRMNISLAGQITLPDYDNKEVKMDDLTKAVYFYYLKNPKGARLKELREHEREIRKYYLGITGRDNMLEICRSVHNFLDPYGNNLNVCMSRIKKAFKNIVGERVAKFYYVDGAYGEPRTIALDRDYVIWDH
ncbi:MAG: hypothetical protein IJS30_05905 [Bacteroidales bacterium]|nr:hypothetical protein [Bacteroidales bacterium]